MTATLQRFGMLTALSTLALIGSIRTGHAQFLLNPTAKVTDTSTSATVTNVVQSPGMTIIDTYRTELTARLGAGPALYDQVLSASFSDPAFQSAIITAENALSSAASGPISFQGPTLVSNQVTTDQGSPGSSTSTSMVYTGFRTTNGPENTPNVSIGPDRTQYGGVTCTGILGPLLLPTSPLPATNQATGTIPTGCTGGQQIPIPAGSTNIDTVVTTVVTTTQSGLTENRLTSQTYDIVGLAVPTGMPVTPGPTTVPEPGAIGLLATGLAALGMARRKTGNVGTAG